MAVTLQRSNECINESYHETQLKIWCRQMCFLKFVNFRSTHVKLTISELFSKWETLTCCIALTRKDMQKLTPNLKSTPSNWPDYILYFIFCKTSKIMIFSASPTPPLDTCKNFQFWSILVRVSKLYNEGLSFKKAIKERNPLGQTGDTTCWSCVP